MGFSRRRVADEKARKARIVQEMGLKEPKKKSDDSEQQKPEAKKKAGGRKKKG